MFLYIIKKINVNIKKIFFKNVKTLYTNTIPTTQQNTALTNKLTNLRTYYDYMYYDNMRTTTFTNRKIPLG